MWLALAYGFGRQEYKSDNSATTVPDQGLQESPTRTRANSLVDGHHPHPQHPKMVTLLVTLRAPAAHYSKNQKVLPAGGKLAQSEMRRHGLKKGRCNLTSIHLGKLAKKCFQFHQIIVEK